MRFKALDAIRGIAATIVALVHLTAAGYFYDIPIIRNGGIAVPLFFVLSGFVIASSYGKRLNSSEELKTFFIRRFGRVYPIHILTLAILVLLEFMKMVMTNNGVQSGQPPFAGSNSVASLIANVFLLQSIVPFGDYTWNGPSWSLSVEFYTYLIFAAVTFFSVNRSNVWTLFIWSVSGVALLLIELTDTHVHITSGRGLLQCLFGFMSGVLLHSLFTKNHRILGQHATALETVASVVGVAMFWFNPFGDVGTIVAFSIIIFVFAGDAGKVSTFLRSFPLQFLGMISLSIYLTHFVILSVLNGGIRAIQSAFKIPLMTNINTIDFGPTGSMDVLAIIYLFVVLSVSATTFMLVEEPFRLYFNSLSKGQRPRYSIKAGFEEILRLRDDCTISGQRELRPVS